MADWKDLTVIVCAALVVTGAAALYTAAESFTIIKGKVVGKGVAINIDEKGEAYFIKTISILIENDDRVYDIKKGSVVEYAISDSEEKLVDVGREIQIFVSAYRSEVKVLDTPSEQLL